MESIQLISFKRKRKRGNLLFLPIWLIVIISNVLVFLKFDTSIYISTQYSDRSLNEFNISTPNISSIPNLNNICDILPPKISKQLINRKVNPDDTNQSLVDVINRGIRVSFPFERCQMSNCFNFSRCQPNKTLSVAIMPIIHKSSLKAGQNTPTIQTDDGNNIEDNSLVIYQNILTAIKNSKHFEPDTEKACILVPVEDTLDRDPLSSGFKTELDNLINHKNNYGLNYLLFNLYSGTWPDYIDNDYSGINLHAAMVAKASSNILYHRPNFDISIPLFSSLHPARDTSRRNINAFARDTEKRNIFLSFKGKRYIFGRGSEVRNSLHHIDNDRDVIMLTTCKHGKRSNEADSKQCDTDEKRYGTFDFVDLMNNSTFCLAPRGRRLGSFRYLEAMSHGCVPVVLSDGWEIPFKEVIDLSKTTILLPERSVLLVPELLRDIKPDEIASKRRENLRVYEQHFSSIEKITLTVLSVIEKRIDEYYSKNQG